MMTKLFFISILLNTLSLAWAQDISEEALILNQELQFLEDRAQGTKVTDLEGSVTTKKRKVIEESLERIYFGEEETDTVSTRTSGPKRKRSLKQDEIE